MDAYQDFLISKRLVAAPAGFDAGTIPPMLFEYQQDVTRWACKRGRAAIFSRYGTGKTPMQLAWAEQVCLHTSGDVLILAPLAALQYRIGSGGMTPGNVAVTGLNWDVSPYTISGTNSASEMAQMCLNLIQGWKLDTAANGSAAGTSSYKSMIKTYYYAALVAASASSGREVKPAQYGYQQNIWGLFPQAYQEGGQYQSYDAIHEFNA